MTFKLISVVLAIFIVVLLTTSFFSYRNTSNDTGEVFKGLQKLALSSSFTTINITMNIEAQQHLKAIASFLENVDQDDILAQRKYLFSVADLIQYPAVYVTYENTGKTLTEEFEPGKKAPTSTQWDNVGDLRERDWYIETKKKNDFLVTPTYVSQVGANKGKVLSTAAIPFYKNGKFAGVIGVDIFVDGFQARFKNFERPELPSMDISIADSEGTVFSRKNPPSPTDPSPTPLEIHLGKALKTSSEGQIEYTDYKGQRSIAFYKRFPFDWTIVARADKNDYEEAITRNFVSTMLLTLILLAVGAILLYFVIRMFISPVKTIREGLLSFFKYINHETKEPPKSILIKTHDELGEMGQAINENIVSTQKGLEQDAKAVEQAVATAKTIEAGDLRARITETPNNPQLNELKEVLNHMLDDLQHKIGRDTNEIARVFNSYTQLDFTTEVKDASGRVEVVTNTLGEEIRKMLSTSAGFAQTLGEEAHALSEAVANLTNLTNTQASSLEQTAQAVEEITSSMQNVSSKTGEVIQQSEDIKNVIGIIRDIADQTNLLA
ncbi:MAG: methyl-accepting chemotaxis protein, partial [Helicobacter sp.]|uniref:methyl-accepting chemotaxis protein n=1 Tax=Helicobacter sp. TaxID=218 RepID=UPI0025BD07B1